MLFIFHTRKEKQVQTTVREACATGAALHGDRVVEIEGYHGVVEEADGTIIVGIGGVPGTPHGARTVFDDYLAVGKRVLFFDKGYTRADRMRVSVDSFQPLEYLMRVKMPEKRIRDTGVRPKLYTGGGEYILFDGASQKYCQWYGLGNQVEWGVNIIRKIREHTDLPIVYRPRPSHNPMPGLPLELSDVEVSQLPLVDDLARARVVVSHGGNLGWDAVVAGRPHFAIDISIARPVSEIKWSNVGVPYVPSEAERWQWMCNVAYCQWRHKELLSGEAWTTIRQQLMLTRHKEK